MDKLRVLKHYAYQEVTADLINSIASSLFTMQDGIAQAFIAGFQNSDHLIFQDLDVTPDNDLSVFCGLKGVFLYRTGPEDCIVGVYKGYRPDRLTPYEEETLSLAPADLTNPRIDIIEAEIVEEDDVDYYDTVQMFNQLTETSEAALKYVRRVRNVKLYIKTGVAAVNPVAPVATVGRFAVKELRVAANATVLVQNDIINQRIIYQQTQWTQPLNKTRLFPSIYEVLTYVYENPLTNLTFWVSCGIRTRALSLGVDGGTNIGDGLRGIKVAKSNPRLGLFYSAGLSGSLAPYNIFLLVGKIEFNGKLTQFTNLNGTVTGGDIANHFSGPLCSDVKIAQDDTVYAVLGRKIYKSNPDLSLPVELIGPNNFAPYLFRGIAINEDTGTILVVGRKQSLRAVMLRSTDEFATAATETLHPSANAIAWYSDVIWNGGNRFVAVTEGSGFSVADNLQKVISYSDDDGVTFNDCVFDFDVDHADKIVLWATQIYKHPINGYLYVVANLSSNSNYPAWNGYYVLESVDGGVTWTVFGSFVDIPLYANALNGKSSISFSDGFWFIAAGGATGGNGSAAARCFVTRDFSTFQEMNTMFPTVGQNLVVTPDSIASVTSVTGRDVIAVAASGKVLYGRRDLYPIV